MTAMVNKFTLTDDLAKALMLTERITVDDTLWPDEDGMALRIPEIKVRPVIKC